MLNNAVNAKPDSRLVRIAKRLTARVDRLVEEVLPVFHYLVRSRKKLKQAEDGDSVKTAEYESQSEEVLIEILSGERSRGAALDEKTFKMTLSLTFGIGIVGTLSPFLLRQIESPFTRWLCAFAVGLSVLYALMGGFVALGSMRTRPVYGLRLKVPKSRPGARRHDIADSIVRNEFVSLARHQRNETAYICLRNGFICLLVALLFFLFDLFTFSAPTASMRSSFFMCLEANESTDFQSCVTVWKLISPVA